jgi:mannitol-specific phosphotransferase system IIBC component
MGSNTPFNIDMRTGIWSGTVLVVLANITAGELLKTVILAAIGAVVSFVVSWLLKRSVVRYKRHRQKSS